MRHRPAPLLALCILGTFTASGRELGEEPIDRVKPALPGVPALEVNQRRTGSYSASSTAKDTDPRDGIGVRPNWAKKLGDKTWAAKETTALVAFPHEAVPFGKHRGMVLRLVHRGKKPALFQGCDSRLPIVQEALDPQGRWREIENLRSSKCGDSYHELSLGRNEYWEFVAPVYTGPMKTKIRFRLDATEDFESRKPKRRWIYSNVFDGAVTKEQFRMEPRAVEIATAFDSRDAREEGVVDTLIELLADVDGDRAWLVRRAVDHLGELGPAAKRAVPALQRLRDRNPGELRARSAYAIWRLNGDAATCMRILTAILESPGKDYSRTLSGHLLGRMGAAASDAVPVLCRALENDDEGIRAAAAHALGHIHAQPGIAVPALMKALKWKSTPGPDIAAEALAKFRGDAKEAVPALKDLAKQGKDHERVEAGFALWMIEGKTDNAVPILVKELQSGQAYRAIYRLGQIGPPASAAVPDLTGELQNKDHRLGAAQALWKITQKPEPTLSIMIRVLKKQDAHLLRSGAIAILADMGPQAKPAVPALVDIYRSLWKNPDVSLQEEIENALRKIDPAAAEEAGVP
jgi:HEAT repeat protein